MQLRLPLFFLLLSLSAGLFLSGCDDDDSSAVTGTVNVNFSALYDDDALAVQSETYDYPDGSKLKLQLFQYYVSDLELLPADGGAAVALSDILLVRYNNATEDNVDDFRFDGIPAGEYSGIRFGVGVSPDLNAMPPNEFAADFVLNEAEYWNPNIGYVFAKIEANVDLEDDGTFDTPVSYHLGSDDVYTVITFDAPITVAAGNSVTLDVISDVRDALVASETDFQDFTVEGNRVVHGGNQAVAADVWTRLVSGYTLSIR